MPLPCVWAQLPAIAGQITELSIKPLTGASYYWTIYCNPGADFAIAADTCSGGEAGFVDGINDLPTVRVKWNKSGIYFFKILVINPEGCSNFKAGMVEVRPIQIDVSIFPNPVTGDNLNFRIDLREGSVVTVDLFSFNHQLISRIFDDYIPGGVTKTISYRIMLPQGLYTYQIRTKDQIRSGRIMLIRVY